VIVADTGAIIALIDADDRHHDVLVQLYEADPSAWLLPWAILPEVDYLVRRHLGNAVAEAFLQDVTSGAFSVDYGEDQDLHRAGELRRQYEARELGLVDSIVAAMAERVRAKAIATVDLRDFGGLRLAGAPKLLPRDVGVRGSW
jgi:predicted nucleic acid-binding protein